MNAAIRDLLEPEPSTGAALDPDPHGAQRPTSGRGSAAEDAEPDILNLNLARADGELIARMLLARVRLEHKKLRNAQSKPDRPLHPALLRQIHQVIEHNTRLASWLTHELARTAPAIHTAHSALLRQIHQVVEQNTRLAGWLTHALARTAPAIHPSHCSPIEPALPDT